MNAVHILTSSDQRLTSESEQNYGRSTEEYTRLSNESAKNLSNQIHEYDEEIDDYLPLNDYSDRLDRLQSVHAQSSAETSGLGDSLQRMHALSSTETSTYYGLFVGASGGATLSPLGNDLMPDVPIRHGKLCAGRPGEPLRQRSFEDDTRPRANNLCETDSCGVSSGTSPSSAGVHVRGIGRTRYQSHSTHALSSDSFNGDSHRRILLRDETDKYRKGKLL